MSDLSFSFHIGCKGHSIATRKALSAIAKHIMMKWKKDKEKQIIPLFDYDTNIVQAVENLYHSEFDEAVLKYNSKQKREDRKIQSYSDKIDADGKTDFATEAILQVGDKDFWAQFTLDEQAKIMKKFYEDLIKMLQVVCPDFKIANATLHVGEKTYDKDGNFLHYGSPHVHIIGLPVGTGYKRGLERQVSKKKVFTPDLVKDGVFVQGTLSKIQDYLHEKSDELIHKYLDDVQIKRKEEGRPFSYTVQGYKDAKDKERLQAECEALEAKKTELEKDIDAMQNKYNRFKFYVKKTVDKVKKTISDIDDKFDELDAREANINAREADLLQREYEAITDRNFFYNNTYPKHKKRQKELEEKETSLNAREKELNSFAAEVAEYKEMKPLLNEYKRYKGLHCDTVKLYKFIKTTSAEMPFPMKDINEFIRVFLWERSMRVALENKFGHLNDKEKPAEANMKAIFDRLDKDVETWEKQEQDAGFEPFG